jgi:hypothetical protein
MVLPDTIRDAIAMMRRRVLEIDGLIERMERERTSLHEVRKKDSPQSLRLRSCRKKRRSGN